jgi:hypothetical protein
VLHQPVELAPVIGNWPGSEKSRSENAISRESGKREGNPWYEIDRSIQQLLDLPNALN